MTLTTFAQAKMFATILGTTYTPPTLYLAAYATTADPSGAHDEITGVDGYTRQPVTFYMGGSGTTIFSVADTVWPGLGATTITGWGIWDDPTAGNLWDWWDQSPFTIPAGSDLTIPANNVQLGLP